METTLWNLVINTYQMATDINVESFLHLAVEAGLEVRKGQGEEEFEWGQPPVNPGDGKVVVIVWGPVVKWKTYPNIWTWLLRNPEEHEKRCYYYVELPASGLLEVSWATEIRSDQVIYWPHVKFSYQQLFGDVTSPERFLLTALGIKPLQVYFFIQE